MNFVILLFVYTSTIVCNTSWCPIVNNVQIGNSALLLCEFQACCFLTPVFLHKKTHLFLKRHYNVFECECVCLNLDISIPYIKHANEHMRSSPVLL